MDNKPPVRKDILYPDLSYDIVNVLFDVFKQMGWGHQERYYQKGVAVGLTNKGYNFVEQYYVPLKFNDQIVGKYFLDFLIEGKIVLELKRAEFITPDMLYQTKQYLSALNLQLGIIACFTQKGVIFKRVVNIK